MASTTPNTQNRERKKNTSLRPWHAVASLGYHMAHHSAGTAAPRKRHRIDVPVCWGSILGGSSDCEAVPSKMGAFREKFCAVCRKRGVLVPTTRVRVPVGPMSELANQTRVKSKTKKESKPRAARGAFSFFSFGALHSTLEHLSTIPRGTGPLDP